MKGRELCATTLRFRLVSEKVGSFARPANSLTFVSRFGVRICLQFFEQQPL